MTILDLVLSPDPLLKEISKEVEKIDDNLKKFMHDMLETMYHEQGVGLAAVQVGALIRAIVMDVDYKLEVIDQKSDLNETKFKILNKNPKFIINPKILESSSTLSTYKEGCLSFPGASSEVIRPQEVNVKYLNLEGKEIVEKMTGLAATCIQHEIDHTNGITFVDHISKIKRDMILKKMKKRNNK